MELIEIKKALNGEDKKEVDNFMLYLDRLSKEQKKNKDSKKYELANPWIFVKDVSFYVDCFNKIKKTKLSLDGKHITINSRGVSLDYIAYKNKMLIAYPDTKFDFCEVYAGDDFNFSKANGKLTYSHKIANPFNRDYGKIIGAYCVIINPRGEFLTLLDSKEIQKHKKISLSNIWDDWFIEMVYKTVIKKATRIHFDDIYEDMNEIDNETIDLTKEIELEVPSVPLTDRINQTKTPDELNALWTEISRLPEDEKKKMIALCTERKKVLLASNI